MTSYPRWPACPTRKKSDFTFWKSCPQLTDSEVPIQSAMISDAREITYRTFRKAVGGEELDRWAKAHGYGRDLPLCRDWHVAFYKSHWNGKPCYFLVWSAMENIWRSE